MEFLSVLLFALLFGGLFALLLAGLGGWRRPGSDAAGAAFFFLFLILFPVIWAAGLWVQPYGPTLWGVAWLPLLIVGLVVGLLIAAAAPPRRRVAVTGDVRETEMALSAFFWLFLGLTALLILFALI